MKKEFKVIIGESVSEVRVLVDNQPIGLIQEIKFHAATEQVPQVEIVFPDLRKISADAAKKVSEQIAKLSGLPQVKVTLVKVEFPTT